MYEGMVEGGVGTFDAEAGEEPGKLGGIASAILMKLLDWY